MAPSFDLEHAITAWRRPFDLDRAFGDEDVEELEGSLRDRIDALVDGGMPVEAAFHEAVRRMGSYGTAETEYRKVYHGKLRQRRAWGTELAWHAGMLRNYLTVAYRNVLRRKTYAAINLFGLAIGLACFILILLFVQHEQSYDRFHAAADHIYRVVQRQPGNDFLGSDRYAVTPAPLARTLVEAFPEVRHATTLNTRNALLGRGDQNFWEDELGADAHFFDVFSFPLLRGDPATALAAPRSLVLTTSLAARLFGDEDPMGKTVDYQDRFGAAETYTVTGIIDDVPATSSLSFTYIRSLRSEAYYVAAHDEGRWRDNSWHTFFVLADGADAGALQAKMPAFVQTHVYAGTEALDEAPRAYELQRLTDLHLHSDVNFDIGQPADARYVYLFMAVAFVILLLACVNYTNLAVARSIQRAHEVGMRKVVGARRPQIVGQFLGESILTACLALALALALVHLLLPAFGRLVDRPLVMDYLANPLVVPALLALVLIVGTMAGAYPALFMGGMQPMRVLKGGMAPGRGRHLIQRLLITGQYAVSVALIVSSLVIYQQLQYVRHKDVGYDRQHVLTIPVKDQGLIDRYEALRETWLGDPNVLAVTASSDLPTDIEWSTRIESWEGSDGGDEIVIYQNGVDYDFLDVFGIALVAGRTFSRDVPSDGEGAYLINETAARTMGWTPQEAIGKAMGDDRRIIGVIRDFHMHSMHLPILPLRLELAGSFARHLAVRVRPDDLPATVAMLERSIRDVSSYPFEYAFLDDRFDAIYRTEQRLGETFGAFTVMALLIASLGLFGLAAFAAEQRTKEIGVRKVLGASASGLVALLSTDFLRLVGIAFVVGAPLAYLVMTRWLDAFAYRVTIGPGVFVLTGVVTLAIALAAVSFQAVRAARADPVRSLRYE